jgi:hypothetical protein
MQPNIRLLPSTSWIADGRPNITAWNTMRCRFDSRYLGQLSWGLSCSCSVPQRHCWHSSSALPCQVVMYHRIHYSKILHPALKSLCVFYGPQNKRRLLTSSSLTLDDVTDKFSETSATNYQSTICKIPEKWRSYLHRGWRLKFPIQH